MAYPMNLPVTVGVARHIAPRNGRTKENDYVTPLELLNIATSKTLFFKIKRLPSSVNMMLY